MKSRLVVVPVIWTLTRMVPSLSAETALVRKSSGSGTQPVQWICGTSPRASTAKTWMLSSGVCITAYRR
ncbi:MAG: hypothetical protein BGN82_11095 [Alphaproteobacteria bacterium 65-7]|nr:MAG: hypothetical protein BGN82_11095 [Alphaproteobacteria bacterium 65-7]